MNIIKGLVIKDILQLKSYQKTLFVFIIVFGCISLINVMQGNMTMISTMALMLILGFGMFAMASFSYDEMAKADKYLLALPITRKQMVLSKYILIIGVTLVGSILGFIFSRMISVVSKQVIDMKEQWCMILGGIWGIGFVQSIQIPCIYKYGVEKGRFFIFLIIFIIAFLVGGIFYIGEKLSIQIQIDNLNHILENYFSMILAMAIIITYGISYVVSLKIFSKKEIQ